MSAVPLFTTFVFALATLVQTIRVMEERAIARARERERDAALRVNARLTRERDEAEAKVTAWLEHHATATFTDAPPPETR